VCVDTKLDAANCGKCGVACADPLTCVDGACGCALGGMMCDGACVDTKTDAANCGACGMACGTGTSCLAGACKCPNAGEVFCNDMCMRVDGTDNNNCGACGKVCMGTTTCCKGVCANITNDKNNCSMCGKVCATKSDRCVNSACMCGVSAECTGAQTCPPPLIPGLNPGCI
jgi:hypothetical protein